MKTDRWAPMPRTTSTELIVHREVKLVRVWRLHPYILVYLAQEGTLQAMELETWTPPQPQSPSAYNLFFQLDVLGRRTCGSGQLMFSLT